MSPFESCHFKIIARNMKAIFRENFSSFRVDAGKIFKITTFIRVPRATYCTLCFYRVIQTLVKVWENSKKLWKHSPVACVLTAFLVLPNFHSCLYNSFSSFMSYYYYYHYHYYYYYHYHYHYYYCLNEPNDVFEVHLVH